MKAFDVAVSVPWAMQQERLDEILAIAERRNEISDEALEQFRSASLRDAEQATLRDGTAILTVQGPLFKRANLFTAISGASSYEMLMRDMQTALDDPSVRSIMLKVDSPGGEASGADEFAQAVYQARKKKPVYAHISGMGASAAYWIASAAEKIYVSDLANVGSIGVVAGMKVVQEREGDRVKTYEFVSSQSPNKRANMESDEGRASMQARVDEMASVFISAVARNRSVKAEDVIANFGRGGVLIGANAVAAGMADKVGLFEAAMVDLKERGSRRATGQNGATRMTDETNGGAKPAEIDTAKIRDDAAKAERQRISAIHSHADAARFPKAVAFMVERGTSADDAKAQLDAMAEDAPKLPDSDAAAGGGQISYDQSKPEAMQLGAMGGGAPEKKPVAASLKPNEIYAARRVG